MRNLVTAVLAGASVLGAGAVAQTAQAQPYGYYYNRPPPPPAYYPYNGSGYYTAPSYRPNTAYTPYNSYTPYGGYNSGSSSGLSAGLAVLGSALGLNTGGYGAPYDRYGYDPNGMIAPDGHRIKCKNRRVYDGYYGGYVTRRVCR
jgi:hypothetical protein